MASRARRKKLPAKRTAASKARSSTRRVVSKSQAKSQGRTAARRRKATPRPSRAALKRQAEEQRAFNRLFVEQIDPLWTRFGSECRQFAEGFNAEWGSQKFQVETGADFVMARFDGCEVLVQLVRENLHAFCVMTSACNDLGACTVDQLPVGFSIADGRLGFMFGPEAMTEESLTVKLLTSLVGMNAPVGGVPDTQST